MSVRVVTSIAAKDAKGRCDSKKVIHHALHAQRGNHPQSLAGPHLLHEVGFRRDASRGGLLPAEPSRHVQNPERAAVLSRLLCRLDGRSDQFRQYAALRAGSGRRPGRRPCRALAGGQMGKRRGERRSADRPVGPSRIYAGLPESDPGGFTRSAALLESRSPAAPGRRRNIRRRAGRLADSGSAMSSWPVILAAASRCATRCSRSETSKGA